MRIAEDQLESLSAINRLVELRVRRGASPRAEAVQAQSRIQSAVATIQQITAELRRWQSNLRHLTGREGQVSVSPDAPAWLGNACRILDPDMDRVPGIMRSIAQRDEAGAQYRGARAARFPTVSLSGEVDTDIRDPFAQRNDVSVGITISSSLYNGGARRAREQVAYHALQSADAALAAARIESSQLLAEGQEQVESLQARLSTLKNRRETMQETGRLYRLQYFELGTRTLLDLLNAEQEFHQTRFEEASAEHDVRRLNIECLYAGGGLRESFGLNGTVVRGVTL